MPEGLLLMTQAERDRLVALKKAKKKLITQKQAAEELGITERHVRRLLRELQRHGGGIPYRAGGSCLAAPGGKRHFEDSVKFSRIRKGIGNERRRIRKLPLV